jgi:hypothetical protein
MNIEGGYARVRARPDDEEPRRFRADPVNCLKFGGRACPQVKASESGLVERFENLAVVSNPRFSQPI